MRGAKNTIQSVLARLQPTEGGCLVWPGWKNKGYGKVKWHGKSPEVHLVVWRELKGEIPAGMVIHHRCHNRACANVDHLQIVTRGEHVNKIHPEGPDRGRRSPKRAARCRNGHPDSEMVLDCGPPHCRLCRREYMKAYRQKNLERLLAYDRERHRNRKRR